MKMIRSFLILATAIAASNTLYAQEKQKQVKTEIDKPVASTVPPPGTKPVLVPDAKPFTAKPITAQPMIRSEQVVSATPSTLTRNINTKLPGTESISAEKIVEATPILINPNIKPLPIEAPAVLKVKENQ